MKKKLLRAIDIAWMALTLISGFIFGVAVIRYFACGCNSAKVDYLFIPAAVCWLLGVLGRQLSGLLHRN